MYGPEPYDAVEKSAPGLRPAAQMMLARPSVKAPNRPMFGFGMPNVNVFFASSFERVYGPGPKMAAGQCDPVAGAMNRSNDWYTVSAVIGVPSEHFSPELIVKVIDVGVTFHDLARYGTTLPLFR